MDDTHRAAQAASDRLDELTTYASLYRENYGHTLNVARLAANDPTYQRHLALAGAAR